MGEFKTLPLLEDRGEKFLRIQGLKSLHLQQTL